MGVLHNESAAGSNRQKNVLRFGIIALILLVLAAAILYGCSKNSSETPNNVTPNNATTTSTTDTFNPDKMLGDWEEERNLGSFLSVTKDGDKYSLTIGNKHVQGTKTYSGRVDKERKCLRFDFPDKSGWYIETSYNNASGTEKLKEVLYSWSTSANDIAPDTTTVFKRK